jgi:hypothetical protein
VNLAETIERRAPSRPRRQQLAGVLRVPGRFIPLAAHLEHFGAIEQALAAIAHEIRFGAAPARECSGPFVGAAQVENLLASLQHGAVGIARQYRRHVSCDDRDHRFVEQGDTLRDASEADQGAAAALSGLAREITIPISAGDLRCLTEQGLSRGWITLHDSLNGGGYQQKAAHDALYLPLVEDALGSREPAGCGSDGAAELQSHREPAAGSRGAFAVAALEERAMRPFPERLAVVLPSHEIGGRREPFEVLRCQRGVPIGCLEQAIRVRP